MPTLSAACRPYGGHGQRADSGPADADGVRTTLTLLVPGMTCRHCVRTVTAGLRDVPGVEAVQADASSATVVLHGSAAAGEVLAALVNVGFPGRLAPGSGPAEPPG